MSAMETRLHLPESEPPATIKEVLKELRAQKLKPVHEAKNWGDWINFPGHETVISIESVRGLTRHATVEPSPDDPDSLEISIISAFRKLGWYASDEDGEYQL